MYIYIHTQNPVSDRFTRLSFKKLLVEGCWILFSLLALGSAVAWERTPSTVFWKVNGGSEEQGRAWSLFSRCCLQRAGT